MPATKSYYDVLGVEDSASPSEIKKAFRKLAQEHHPDAGGDAQKFQEISEAYETLSDKEKRKEYDDLQRYGAFTGGFGGGAARGGNPYGGRTTYTSGSMDWADILESIRRGEGAFGSEWDFGGGGGFSRSPRPTKGPDLTMTLEVSFDEAFRGTTKKVSYRAPGSDERKELEVKVPAGAVDGGKLRYRKRGEPGMNGGEAGDLVITTRIAKHPFFSRDGADVLVDVPITMYEAILGAEIEVPTPSGSKVRIRVPAGTPDGKVFRVKDAGAPDVKRKDGSKGALLATMRVVPPTDLTDRERELLTELRDIDTRDVRAELR